MPEPGDDVLQVRRRRRAPPGLRPRRITLVALIWVSTVAITICRLWRKRLTRRPARHRASSSPLPSPGRHGSRWSASWRPSSPLIISTPPHSYGELNHAFFMTQLAATALAMWISPCREAAKRPSCGYLEPRQGTSDAAGWPPRRPSACRRWHGPWRRQPITARWPTPYSPRCATSCKSARPRSSLLRANAGSLHTLRRFGYDPDESSDGVLTTFQLGGPVLGQNVALFAESLDDLRRQRLDVYTTPSFSCSSGFGPSRSFRCWCLTTRSVPSSCTGTKTARFPIPIGVFSSPLLEPQRRPWSVPA